MIVLVSCLAFASPTAEEAEAAYQAENWEAAADAYKVLAKKNPEDAGLVFRQGVALEKQHKYPPAEKAFRKALERGFWPNYGELALARTLALQGKRDDAREALKRAIAGGLSQPEAITQEGAFAVLWEQEGWDDLVQAIDRNARPCMYSEPARQFDFWVGSWRVEDEQGNVLGTNTIESVQNGCVLVENWTGEKGSSGISLNRYDPAKKAWVQDWVSATGWHIHYEGKLDSTGSLVMIGTQTTAEGATSGARGTWTPRDDGSVVQLLESSEDAGTTWKVVFKGIYLPAE